MPDDGLDATDCNFALLLLECLLKRGKFDGIADPCRRRVRLDIIVPFQGLVGQPRRLA